MTPAIRSALRVLLAVLRVLEKYQGDDRRFENMLRALRLACISARDILEHPGSE